jgi:uncharacterized membrane protein YdjX (TVP38/TMEM64 family)
VLLYLKTPGMREPGSLKPTQDGIGLAKTCGSSVPGWRWSVTACSTAPRVRRGALARPSRLRFLAADHCASHDPGDSRMRRYWLVVTGMLVLFTALFAVVEALDVPLLTDPEPVLQGAPLAAAAVGVGLLVLDVVLPVPSSLVMIAHGAAFGPLLGASLSLVGSLGAALLGFAVGRRGGPLLQRVVPAGERRRADALLARWGMLAIVVTRPVPLLAETTVILAGASPLSWRRTALAALVGSVPAAVLYALAGSAAAGLANPVAVFALVLLLAGATWALRAAGGRQVAPPTEEGTV